MVRGNLFLFRRAELEAVWRDCCLYFPRRTLRSNSTAVISSVRARFGCCFMAWSSCLAASRMRSAGVRSGMAMRGAGSVPYQIAALHPWKVGCPGMCDSVSGRGLNTMLFWR